MSKSRAAPCLACAATRSTARDTLVAVDLKPDAVRITVDPPVIGHLPHDKEPPTTPVGSWTPKEVRSVEPCPAINDRHADGPGADVDVETDCVLSIAVCMPDSIRYQLARQQLDVGDALKGQDLSKPIPHMPPSFADGERTCRERVLERGEASSLASFLPCGRLCQSLPEVVPLDGWLRLAGWRSPCLWSTRRQHRSTSHHGFGKIDELSIGSARFISEHVERGLLVDLVSFHQDALRALGHRPSAEGTFEVVVLGKPSKDDVDRALHLLGIMPVRDVGEDAPLRGLVDERPILHIQDRDDRTGSLVHDPVDHLEALRVALVHDHESHIGVLGRRDASDLRQGGLPSDDVMAQPGHRSGDLIEAYSRSIGDQDTQTGDALLLHVRLEVGVDGNRALFMAGRGGVD
jgi:hypothetical protein